MQQIPALDGNWVDLLLVSVFLFYAWDGVRRGFIVGVLDLLSFILSFFVALFFYDLGASFLMANFSLPRGIANAAGFLLLGFLAEILLAVLLRQFIKYIPAKIKKSRAEKILGIIPAAVNTAVLGAFVLTLLIILPLQGSIKSDIVSSRIGGALVRKTQGVERELNKVFGQAIEDSLTFLTVEPSSDQTVELNFTQTELAIDQTAEREMFKMLNRERRQRGFSDLEFATGPLQKVARDYAKDMFRRGYFSHYNPEGQSPFDRMEQAGIEYLTAGENLALAPNVKLAHQGLMDSPGHRANILSEDYNRIGIGVIDGGIYGKMFVQEFTN